MVRFSDDAYRAEMDVLAAFMEERTQRSSMMPHGGATPLGATPLHGAYKGWCAAAGENPETQTRFGTMLGDRGLPPAGTPRRAARSRDAFAAEVAAYEASHPEPEGWPSARDRWANIG